MSQPRRGCHVLQEAQVSRLGYGTHPERRRAEVWPQQGRAGSRGAGQQGDTIRYAKIRPASCPLPALPAEALYRRGAAQGAQERREQAPAKQRCNQAVFLPEFFFSLSFRPRVPLLTHTPLRLRTPRGCVAGSTCAAGAERACLRRTSKDAASLHNLPSFLPEGLALLQAALANSS